MRYRIIPLVSALGIWAAASPVAAQDDVPVRTDGSPADWIADADYPPGALRAGAFGITGFRLDVDGTGAVTGCHILMTSGFSALDDATCSIMPRRARFKPARVGGKPVPSTYTGRVTWIPPGAYEGKYRKLLKLTSPFDLTIKVKQLPGRYRMGPLLRMQYDRSGKPTACLVELESGSTQADKVACQQASEQRIVDASKNTLWPMPDSRMVAVQFAEEK